MNSGEKWAWGHRGLMGRLLEGGDKSNGVVAGSFTMFTFLTPLDTTKSPPLSTSLATLKIHIN